MTGVLITRENYDKNMHRGKNWVKTLEDSYLQAKERGVNQLC